MKEANVLNRTIRVTPSGWEYEADQRHADLIINGLNLKEAKGVSSPGEEEKPWQEEENAEALGAKDASQYRTLAARANYLAADRGDIQYATKEVCRGMAMPTRGDMRKLRRLGNELERDVGSY